MANPIFNMLGNNQIGNTAGLIQQFQRFKSSFTGDPQKQIQELLNSGKVSQEQYDRAVQQAKTLQKILGM